MTATADMASLTAERDALAETVSNLKIIADHQMDQLATLRERNAAMEQQLAAANELLNKYEPIIALLAKDYEWGSGKGPLLHTIRNMARAAKGVRLLTHEDYSRPRQQVPSAGSPHKPTGAQGSDAQ